jgi:hypothetical protein
MVGIEQNSFTIFMLISPVPTKLSKVSEGGKKGVGKSEPLLRLM